MLKIQVYKLLPNHASKRVCPAVEAVGAVCAGTSQRCCSYCCPRGRRSTRWTTGAAARCTWLSTSSMSPACGPCWTMAVMSTYRSVRAQLFQSHLCGECKNKNKGAGVSVLILWREQLVSWCFEPSQPQRVISGMERAHTHMSSQEIIYSFKGKCGCHT